MESKNRAVRTLRRFRWTRGRLQSAFGYGLSYTTFSYRGLRLAKKVIHAGDPLTAEVIVTDTGTREGDEVVQVYLNFPNVPDAPLRALRGFKRVHLKPGESQKVSFEFKDRDLSMVSEAGEPIIAEEKYVMSIGGGQPNTDSLLSDMTPDGKTVILCESGNSSASTYFLYLRKTDGSPALRLGEGEFGGHLRMESGC